MTKENTVVKLKKNKQIKMLTFTGKYVDLSNLTEEDIDVKDIAHSLSNLCRYNGHTNRFYSVAEHSVRLARYAVNNLPTENELNNKVAKALLMHDATEAYVGDVIYPLKKALPEFSKFEDKIAEVINKKFGIETDEEVLKHVSNLDRRICFDEMYMMMDGRVDDALYLEGVRPIGVEKLILGQNDYMGWAPNIANERFLAVCAWFGYYIPPSEATIDVTKKDEDEDRSGMPVQPVDENGTPIGTTEVVNEDGSVVKLLSESK